MVKINQHNTHILLIVIVVLPFPEHHIFRLIQYAALSDWLQSRGNVLSSFLPSLSLLESSFLLSPE